MTISQSSAVNQVESRRDNLVALQKREKRVIPGQTKFTASESQALDDLVEFFQEHGTPDATRASVIRALVLDAIAVFKEEMGEQVVRG